MWWKDVYLTQFQDDWDFQVLSCDLFDTLIFRTMAKPEDVFIETAKEAQRKKKMSNFIDPVEFARLRIEADRRARQQLNTEVTIDEIYDQFPDFIGDRIEIKKIEFEIEKACVYLNPSVASLIEEARRKSKQVVFLSDMYFTEKHIRELLHAAGFDFSHVDRIFMSCDWRKTKHGEGRLFEHLLSVYPDVRPEKIVHLGDHPLSDVENPRKYGIRSIHYGRHDLMPDICELESVQPQRVIGEWVSLRRLHTHLNAHLPPKQRFWHAIGGTVIGPLYSLFAEWVVDVAVLEGYKAIYPVMRGGCLLEQLIRYLLTKRGIDGIEVRPLYVSRRLLRFISIPEDVNNKFLNDFLKSRPWMRWKAVWDWFGLEGEVKRQNLMEKYGDIRVGESYMISSNNGRTLYDMLFEFLDENIDVIRKIVWHRKERIVEYFKSEYCIYDSFLTADIGHAGTIQIALHQLFKEINFQGRILHLLLMGNDSILEKWINGVEIRGLVCNAGAAELYRSNNWTPGILDELIREDHGSVIDIEREGDQWRPVFEYFPEEMMHREERQACREGIFDFHKNFLELIFHKPWLKRRLLHRKQDLEWIVRRLMDRPTHEEAVMLGELLHENALDEGRGPVPFCPAELEEEARKIGPVQFLQKRRNSILTWPAGVVARIFPYYFLPVWYDNNSMDQQQKIKILARYVIAQNRGDWLIYGAGQIGSTLLEYLRQAGMQVVGFVDSNPLLWGTQVKGVTVYSPENAPWASVHNVIIASFVFIEEIRRQLLEIEKKFKLYILDWISIESLRER